jgi:CheY-like chemotaxis protein
LNSNASADGDNQDRMSDVAGLSASVSFEAAIVPEMAEIRQRGGNETILLVEDEAFVRRATSDALQSVGYRVVTAESAAQALLTYHECSEPIDLFLVDIVMPGISGEEFARTLFGLSPHVRIILMSGYTEQLALCNQSLYPREYLPKPFSVSTLLKKIRAVLDGNPFAFGTSS